MKRGFPVSDPKTTSEIQEAIKLANKVLETPNRDPDDDLSIMSRQFLRALERIAELEKQASGGLINDARYLRLFTGEERL